MSGITAFRIQWIVGFLLWGAVFTFVDVAARRTEFGADDPLWLQWSVENAAVALTVLAFIFLLWRNRRLTPVLGATFFAFTGPVTARALFVILLIWAAALGAVSVRLLMGQPAFPALGPRYLLVLLGIAGMLWAMSPQEKIAEPKP